MSHQLEGRRLRGSRPRSFLAQRRERLAHDFGLGKSGLPRDLLKEGGSPRIDSDIESAHGWYLYHSV